MRTVLDYLRSDETKELNHHYICLLYTSRDDCAMRLATSYLKEDNLREAAVWFTLMKEVSPLYQDDAVYLSLIHI